MRKRNHLHRRSMLRSVTGSLLLPSLASIRETPTAAASQGTATAPIQRFVGIANLLGFQQKHWFPTEAGRNYSQTKLLEPLMDQKERFTLYRGLDHGLRGGHFAVHTFLSGVLHHEAKNRKTLGGCSCIFVLFVVNVKFIIFANEYSLPGNILWHH